MSVCWVETYKTYQGGFWWGSYVRRGLCEEYIVCSSRWEPDLEWKWQNTIKTIWRQTTCSCPIKLCWLQHIKHSHI